MSVFRGSPRTLLAKVKQQRRALAGILKSGWTTFSGNRDGKEDPFGTTRALIVLAVMAIPQGRERLLWVHVLTRGQLTLRFSTSRPANCALWGAFRERHKVMWRDRQFRSMRRVVSTVPKWTPYVRANTLLTDFAYHAPPRGVLMPRALRASAI
jgi:hypothetical protein